LKIDSIDIAFSRAFGRLSAILERESIPLA
jgi:hypothetical protein